MAKSVLCGFEWKVKNILSITSRESDEFVVHESRWRLQFSAWNLHMKFCLNKLSAEKLNRRYKIRAFIVDRNEQIANTQCDVLNDLHTTSRGIWYISRNELQERRDTYLTDGSLTLVIVFTPRDMLENDEMDAKVKSIQTSVNVDMVANLENLSLDFHHLLDGGIESDVTLKCGERSFPAHKTILSARSEVFLTMFRSNMAENHTGVVQISDVDASVLDQFLHFIYSGKFSDLSVDTAPKLYAAADKYSVESLKKLCVEFMKENLTKENAVRILVLSDIHGDKHLKDAVLCYITTVELLRDKDVWFEFLNESPKLAGEVMHHAYEGKCLSGIK